MSAVDSTFDSLKAVAKLICQSRYLPKPVIESNNSKEIFILANGPSLTHSLQTLGEFLKEKTLLAVNFALNTPQIRGLQPQIYVLADPHFFRSVDPNVESLWENMNGIEHQMLLFVPRKFLKTAKAKITNPNIKLQPFNAVGIEGARAITHRAFNMRLGMPRPRNVLIPSIMIALQCGFKKIILLGADHSWLKTLSVSSQNEVVSIQPHFYADSNEEKNRVRHEYKNIYLHEVLESMTIAFRAYHQIARYADSIGAEIFNATPDSFIDAFPRATSLD